MSLLGSITGADAMASAARSQLAAAKKRNATLLALAEPSLATGRKGLSLLRNYSAYLQEQMGKDSPYIKGQQEASIRGINTTKRTSLANSRRFFRATGNAALGRGEEYRINLAADEATGDTNLAYGQAQEGYKTEAANRYFAGVQSMINAGAQGSNIAVGAASSLYQGTSDAAQLQMQAGMAGTNFLMQLAGMAAGYYTAAAGAPRIVGK